MPIKNKFLRILFIIWGNIWSCVGSLFGLFVTLLFLIFKQIRFIGASWYALEFDIIDNSVFYNIFYKKMRMIGLCIGPFIFYISEKAIESEEKHPVCKFITTIHIACYIALRTKRHEQLGHVFDEYLFGNFYYIIYAINYLTGLIKYKNHNDAYWNIWFEKRARDKEME